MIRNDGSRFNKEAFWENFFKMIGEERTELISITDEFYLGQFKEVRNHVGTNPHARNIVEAARGNGRKVVLATNPVFPMAAQLERISWIGLAESDFDLITSYDNSKFSKPNPDYYRDICEKIGVAPENCLMIGNDERDDMKAATEAGMKCFLVTDCRIMSDHFVWTGERGSFEQALHMLERL
jgi:HAD superfamily hydrolase (TIGR01549 family)